MAEAEGKRAMALDVCGSLKNARVKEKEKNHNEKNPWVIYYGGRKSADALWDPILFVRVIGKLPGWANQSARMRGSLLPGRPARPFGYPY